MTTSIEDPVLLAAWQVADSLADSGYAFVENDMIEPLAATLRAFLQTAEIATNDSGVARPAPTTAQPEQRRTAPRSSRAPRRRRRGTRK